MTDHLPECPRRVIPDRYAEKARAIGIYAGDCICSALRACEQRVLEDERALIAVEQTTLAELNAEYRKGLDAAREAVERVSSLLQPLGPALAAIDVLRGEHGTQAN